MKPKKKPDCDRCNDTGVHETGNNDLPCTHCKAGANAKFNNGRSVRTGRQTHEDHGWAIPAVWGKR